MVKENVPRRLKRFYRSSENSDLQEQENYNYSINDNIQYDNPKSYKNPSIPTMEYEDIDEKNLNEIKKVEQQNLEEKLAMLEIEKFKKEKNRMPNNKEQEQLASSLYEQFKNNPSELEAISETTKRMSGREKRLNRIQGNNQEDNLKINEDLVESPTIDGNTDIKSLFENSDSMKDSKKKDDFDLGLNLDEDDDSELNNDLEELQDFSENKKKKKNI